MSWHRIRTDFRFAILVLFSAVTVVGVTPFAVYRFAHGETMAGVADMLIVLLLTSSGLYVWHGGNVDRAALFTAAAYTLGCVAIAHLVGLPGTLWMYPVLLANFLLIDRRLAIVMAALGIAAIVLNPGIFTDGTQRISFLVTSVVVSTFAFIFAYRTDTQRKQLETLAWHDPLTGIYNRRAMDRELAIAIETFRRHKTPYCLAIVDLDHFKRINDAYGHEAGDRVLIDFVRHVAESTRKADRFFRLGGEEFVLLLPGAEAGSLHIICENLRAHIAAKLRYDKESITVSIGAAALEAGEDAASWLVRADEALYQAKHQGRNQLVVHAGRD
ncbi:MAG: GGDEF domain-containing protein [Luteimonas sp.]